MVEGDGVGWACGEGKSRQPEVKAAIRWGFFLFSLLPLLVRCFSHPRQTTSDPRFLEVGLTSLAKRSSYFCH